MTEEEAETTFMDLVARGGVVLIHPDTFATFDGMFTRAEHPYEKSASAFPAIPVFLDRSVEPGKLIAVDLRGGSAVSVKALAERPWRYAPNMEPMRRVAPN